MILGTLPGVVGGAVVRVELVPATDAFHLVIAAVLLPLGLWLLRARRDQWLDIRPRPRALM